MYQPALFDHLRAPLETPQRLHPAQARLASETSPAGEPELCAALRDVIERGFPETRHSTTSMPEIDIQWNRRLRTTVGRTIYGDSGVRIEINPTYHAAHPGELHETLAHEFAHALHPGDGHRARWRHEFKQALERLGLPLRTNLSCAAHPAPGAGRYSWTCPRCGLVVAQRNRRRRDEVAVYSPCCNERVHVIDTKSGRPAVPRRFQVGCRRCRMLFVAYDDAGDARRFASRHRCRCGARLRMRECC